MKKLNCLSFISCVILFVITFYAKADAVSIGVTGASNESLIADFTIIPGTISLASKKNIHAKCPVNLKLNAWVKVSNAPTGITKLIGTFTTLSNWTTDVLTSTPYTFSISNENEGVLSISRSDTLVANASVRVVMWCYNPILKTNVGFQIPNGSPIDLTKGTFNRY
jgi:hypothetical protein